MSNKKTDTLIKLLSAASECFAEKGYSESTTKEIASRAGIGQGSIYTYFKGKEELFDAIVDDVRDRTFDLYDSLQSGTYLDRLCDFIELGINDKIFPPYQNKLWLEIMAASSRNEYLRDKYIDSDILTREGIEKFIAMGIESGEFRNDLDLNETTIILFSILDGLVCKKAINPNFSLEVDLPFFKGFIKNLLS